MAIQAGEVKAHEQGSGLDIRDLVGEEVGDGLCNVLRYHRLLMTQRPHAGEQWLEVDLRELHCSRSRSRSWRCHGGWCVDCRRVKEVKEVNWESAALVYVPTFGLSTCTSYFAWVRG